MTRGRSSKSRERNAPCFFDCLNLLAEVAVQQTLEGLAVAGFVALCIAGN